jgi:hypothetical protein
MVWSRVRLLRLGRGPVSQRWQALGIEPDGDFVADAVVVHALDERLHEAGLLLRTRVAACFVLCPGFVTQFMKLLQHEALKCQQQEKTRQKREVGTSASVNFWGGLSRTNN